MYSGLISRGGSPASKRPKPLYPQVNCGFCEVDLVQARFETDKHLQTATSRRLSGSAGENVRFQFNSIFIRRIMPFLH
jgi:hypothetical protein